jgi:DNA-binding NarL/FixJ family response regulator
MIRVLIADDHTLFRQGVKALLDGEADMEVVGVAKDSRETEELAHSARPDVVLLDVSMPGRGGIENVSELKRRDPQVKILMLTGHPEDHYAIRCLKSGADGYLTKDAEPEVLLEAIRRVRAGRKFISPNLAEQLAFTLQEGFEKAPHEVLSDREFQVLRMIAGGRTVSEIAEELCLSVKTVSTYRTRILEKMNLRNNAEIMQYAMHEGLVE